MKQLILVRHAKAQPADAAARDFDRPLNRRGQTDAPRIGARMRSWGAQPEHILSSPATRALATARLVVEAMRLPASAIETRDAIYEADAGDLLDMIRAFPPDWERVMLFGHNPSITDVLNVLTDEMIDNIPTCGAALIDFDVTDWARITEGAGQIKAFEYPNGGRSSH